MNLQKLFSRKKRSNSKSKSTPLENPFVLGAEGRKEWNDRYQALSKMTWDWKKAFFMSMGLSILLAIGLIHVSSQSKIQPFAVELTNGMPIAIKSMTPMVGSQQMPLVSYAITDFISNARSILSDTEGEKKLLDKVYAYSANDTIKFMHDYFEKNNPFELASQYTVSVNIINALQISENTWQITWEEKKLSANGGNLINVTRWEANITYKFSEVNKSLIADNPWGLYITQISWSQVQTI
jgi:type IV secretory pathway TrbF-like protein